MLTDLIQLIALFLSTETASLAHATRSYAPSYLTREAAIVQVVAAEMAETKDVSAELLLSLAYSESRYNPRATSRVEKGVRNTTLPLWETPPKTVSGPYFCGVTQADARMSWKKCMELRNIFTAYETTAKELGRWLRVPQCRTADDRMRCALLGYGGGFPAISAETSTYPARVLGRARALKRATQPTT